MQKNVVYTGIELNKNEYDAADGSLGIAFNVINEEGCLEALPYPKAVSGVSLGSNQELVCVHKSAEFGEHKIIYHKTNKTLTMDNVATPFATLSSALKQIVSVGNTLVVMTDAGKEYFLWTTRDGVSKYYSLGGKIDFVDMSFRLENEFKTTDIFKAYNSHVSEWTESTTIPESDQEEVSNAIFGKVADVVSKEHDNKRFVFPFFVRYAVRLYDGSLVNHSSPILMHASNDNPFFALASTYFSRLAYMSSSLYSSVKVSDSFVGKWKDVISSIDIFVSAPQYGIDMSAKIKDVFVPTESETAESKMASQFSVGKMSGSAYYTLNKLYNSVLGISGLSTDSALKQYIIPKNEESSIADTSAFYLLRSIPITSDEFASMNGTFVNVECGKKLNVIRQQELMVDDYRSGEDVRSGGMFIYNQRLHLYNIYRKPCNNLTMYNSVQCSSSSLMFTSYVTIYIDRPDGSKSVVTRTMSNTNYNPAVGIRYFFYPDTKASKAEIRMVSSSGNVMYSLSLKAHSGLNGAYWYDNGASAPTTTYTSVPSDSNGWINEPNKIYTSSVGFPYDFPLAGINTLGVGEIIGLAASAQEMSQGQYGQFPLYCFATDGIWAMSVDASTGLYSAKSSVTSKIAIKGTITSADATVMFATDEGVFALSGSKIQEITDPLDGKFPTSLTTVANRFSCPTLVHWREYVKNVRIAYDGRRDRLYMFNGNYNYYYVLSFRTNLITMGVGTIASVVNVAPDCYVNATINGTYGLYNLAESSATYPLGYVCTRPFKMGNDGLFSMADIIQRGVFANKTDVACVLKGTRDFNNWSTVGSSVSKTLRKPVGVPFRAYRLELFLNMGGGDSLSAFASNVEPRRTNRVR